MMNTLHFQNRDLTIYWEIDIELVEEVCRIHVLQPFKDAILIVHVSTETRSSTCISLIQ